MSLKAPGIYIQGSQIDMEFGIIFTGTHVFAKDFNSKYTGRIKKNVPFPVSLTGNGTIFLVRPVP